MDRVVLVSGHYLQSRRKAGFHWIAGSFHDVGADVLFLTAPISWLSWLRSDHRFQYPVRREANRILRIDERLCSYVWMTPWHPANLRSRVLNRLAGPLFSRYSRFDLGEAEPMIRSADVVIFESTPAILLFPRFRELAPNARFIYRVSDDLGLLRNHPRVLAAEAEFAPAFDLVSVPCAYLKQRFSGLSNVQLHAHGISTDVFDAATVNPYEPSDRPNVLFVGNSHFDHGFLEIAARLRPDLMFHVIGPIPGLPQAPNICAYGEMPFDQTVPYVRFADVGLQTVRYRPGIESMTDSLKVIQYTYCRLPIIAPTFIASDRRHFFHYEPGDDASIAQALRDAAAFDRSAVDRSGIMSWDQVRDALIGSASAVLRPLPDVSLPHHAAS